MPLGEPLTLAPRKLRQVTPWADNVSRPWSETMPVPDAGEGAESPKSEIKFRLVRWALVAALFALAVYALRWLPKR